MSYTQEEINKIQDDYYNELEEYLENPMSYTQEEINKIQDDYYNELVEYLRSLAEELQCSVACAGDVWYLRQRSRWTQELENELICLYNEGTPPNICEFGN